MSMPKYYLYYFMYHFIAEALVTFIVLLPITFSYYEMKHYIAYVLVLLAAAIVYFILESLRVSNLFFILMTIPLILAYYYLQFPIGLALFFPIFFLWRYMNIRHYEQEREDQEPLIFREKINKANLYIKIALPAAALTVLYAKEFYAMGYVLLLLIVIYLGYIVSHLSQVPKLERSRANLRIFTYLPIFFVLGGFLASFIFEPFREGFKKIWLFLANAVIFLAGAVVALIDLIIPKTLKERKDNHDPLAGGDIRAENVQDMLEYHGGIDDAILTLFTALIIIVALLIFIYRMLNKRRAQIFGRSEAQTKYIPEQTELEKEEGFFNKLFSRREKEQRHPVRQLIYNFEKEAKRYELGRHPFESLTEWFERLEIDILVEVYQKVRYGNLDVREEEINKLNEQIKNVSLREIKAQLEIEEEEVGLVNGKDQ